MPGAGHPFVNSSIGLHMTGKLPVI